MDAKHKMKGKKGFTLAETLLAVLILLLVSTIVATGVPAAVNAYEKVVIAANADSLLSTVIAALRDELTTAQKVERLSETSVTYYNATKGAYSKITLEDGEIMLYEYGEYDPMTDNVTNYKSKHELVSQPATKDSNKLELKFTIDPLFSSTLSTDTRDTITVNGLTVTRKGSSEALASVNSLKIRLLVPSPVV